MNTKIFVPTILLIVFLYPFSSAAKVCMVSQSAATPAPSKAISSNSQKAITFSPTNAQATEQRVTQARDRRQADIQKLFSQAGLDYPPRQVLLRAFKNLDVLELWVQPAKGASFIHLKDYAICQRSGILGPKRAQGDFQVPEGFYHLNLFKPDSRFWLSMQLNYPNASDKIRKMSNRKPGGLIFIHGDCVTIGCIPLTDRWIEELYLICLDSATNNRNRVQVHIFPDRLTGENWTQLKQKYAAQPSLLAFWEELKPGYEYFEKNHRPASFTIDRRGAYSFR